MKYSLCKATWLFGSVVLVLACPVTALDNDSSWNSNRNLSIFGMALAGPPCIGSYEVCYSQVIDDLATRRGYGSTTSLGVFETSDWVFILQDGSGANPSSYTDLIPLLPFIDHINSIEFLNWVESKENTERRQIVLAVEHFDVAGDVALAVEKLIVFTHAETNIFRTQEVLSELYTGSFISHYMNLTEDDRNSIMISKRMYLSALRSLSSGSPYSRSNNTALCIYKSRESNLTADCMLKDWGGIGWGAADIIYAQLPFFLANGELGNWDPKTISILTGALLIDVGSELSEFLSSSIGMYANGARAFWAMCSISMDIDALVNGNLTGLDIAIKTISLVYNVISLVLVIGSMISTSFGAVAGPVGLIVGMIANFAMLILMDIQKQKQADKAVDSLLDGIYLTPKEQQAQWDRVYGGEDIDPMYYEWAQQRESNEQLVDKISTDLQHSASMQSVRMFIAPAIQSGSNPKFYENNVATLTTKRTVRLARWSPMQSSIPTCCPWKFTNRIECFPEDTSDSVQNEYAYPCGYAVGVMGVGGQRERNIIDLKNGTDSCDGESSFDNVFVVESGSKQFNGGGKNDTFFIKGPSVSGTLDGKAGYNALVLDANSLSSGRGIINLQAGTLDVSTFNVKMNVRNMRIIAGRTGIPDTVMAACDTVLVDLMGGTSSLKDEVTFSSSCHHNVTVQVGRHTNVRMMDGPTGLVALNVPLDGDGIDIFVSPTKNENINVGVMLGFNVTSISNFKYDPVDQKNHIYFGASNAHLTTSTIFEEDSPTRSNMPFIRTQDEVFFMSERPSGMVTSFFQLTQKASNEGGNERAIFSGVSWGQNNIVLGKPAIPFSQVNGGPFNDTIMLNDTYSGTVDGREGHNLIGLGILFHPTGEVTLDLAQGRIFVGSTKTVDILGFQMAVGRPKMKDILVPRCSTTFLDGQEGGYGDLTHYDRILINEDPSSCSYSLIMSVRQNTVVDNHVTTNNASTFIYLTEMSPHIEFNLNLDRTQNGTTHVVQLQSSINNILAGDVKTMEGQPQLFTLTLSNNDGVQLQVPMKAQDEPVTRAYNPNGDDDAQLDLNLISPIILTNDTQPVLLQPTILGKFAAIFNITSPEPKLTGANFADNFFVLHSNVDVIYGSEKKNLYQIEKDSGFQGHIMGNLGSDRLTLDAEFGGGAIVAVNWVGTNIKAIFPQQENVVLVSALEQFLGRAMAADHLTVDCTALVIDGNGGLDAGHLDLISLTTNDEDCVYNLNMFIQNFTQLKNSATIGNLLYTMRAENGIFDFVSGVSQLLNHTVLLDGWSKQNLTAVDLLNSTQSEKLDDLSILIQDIQGHSRTFKLAPFDSENSTFITQPRIFTSELVEFKVNRQGQVNGVFVIKDGDDTDADGDGTNNTMTTGFNFLRNIFVCEGNVAGTDDRTIVGGPLEDTFIISNVTFTGLLDGLEGNNSLIINADGGDGPLEVGANYMEGSKSRILFENIKYIYGRAGGEGLEKVTVDCNVSMINLNGGPADHIIVPNVPDCIFSLQVGIHENTVVDNYGQNGSFFYTLHDDVTTFTVNCHDCVTAIHTFALPYDFASIASIKVDNDTKTLQLSVLDETVEPLEDDRTTSMRNYSLSGLYYLGYPRLLTRDLVQLELTHWGRRVMVQSNNETLDTLVPHWKEVATRLNVTVSIFSSIYTTDDKIEKTYINIGCPAGTIDVLQTSPGHRSILLGNGGRNAYIIGKGDVDLGSIPEIVIQSEANSSDLIDLTQLVRPIRDNIRMNTSLVNRTLYVPQVLYEDQDMVLLVEDQGQSGLSTRVIIKDWAQWYLNASFVLNDAFMELKFLNGKWTLEPSPVVINKTHILLDQNMMEDNSVLEIQRDLPLDRNNSLLKYGNHVVLTNVYNSSETDQMFVLLLEDFQQPLSMRRKVHGSMFPDDEEEEFIVAKNVHLKFQNDAVLKLDEVDLDFLRPIDDVMIEEEVAVGLIVFGFKCKAEGSFPDPRFCDRYHVCVLVGTEFSHTEFACPVGTVYCIDLKLCSYPGTCADCNDSRRL